ncbi:NAD(P)-dependent oxidoreductase [Chitinophaga agri]|uniref:NAD(P)-dependent oxidoreductase n=1 Tax=Chitinophaga agri TaxID=2703787 RepID=A0A6B9ZCX8_9BACT|nr:NAD(P)-dependent oxidoreductase [Chitinophaga agri]QHS59997.1 NAD(P)-dependent oxidoreductase [Chitinophaga agri]
MSNIILIGASGFVGSAILNEALSRGHQVTAIVRHPEKVTTTHSNLKVIAADIQNAAALTDIIKGADAVISSYNPGWGNPNIYNDTLTGYKSIIDAVKQANVTRLLVVGGAGSLYVKPGVTVMDTGVLPEAIMPGVKGLAEVYYNQLKPLTNLDWAFFSPAGNIAPGERTGNYRLGKDDLIVNDKGESNISVEDYAVAMINELETPQHHNERFTIGY